MKNENNEFNLIAIRKLVEDAHSGQVDKGGHPYIGHLERVMAKVSNRLGELPDELLSSEDKEQALLLALCHDLLEDTSVTEGDLRELGADDLFIKRLYALSRLDKSTTYMDWIRSMADGDDLVPIIVKLGDNEDNNDPERIAQLPETERSISQRYERAHRILIAALERHIHGFEAAKLIN